MQSGARFARGTMNKKRELERILRSLRSVDAATTGQRDAIDRALGLVREQSAEAKWLCVDAVLDRVASALVMVELQSGRVITANAAARRLAHGALVDDLPGSRFVGSDGIAHGNDRSPRARVASGEALEGTEFDVLHGESRVSVVVHAAELPPSDARPHAVLMHFVDVTAQRRSELEQQLIAEVDTVLVSRLECHETMPAAALRIALRFAEMCAVEVVDEHGVIETLALVHRHPRKQELLESIATRLFPRTPGRAMVSRQTRTSLFEPRLRPKHLRRMARGDARLLALLERLDVRSRISIPLFAAGRVLGHFTVVRGADSPRFDGRDLTLMESLAQRITIAIDNSALFGAAQRANRRLMALQEVTEAALSLRSTTALCQAAAAGMRSMFSADSAAVLLVRDAQKFRVIGSDRRAGEYEQEVDRPLTSVVSASLLEGAKASVIDDAGEIERARGFSHAAEIETLLVAPLRLGDQIQGVLHVGTRDRRAYSDDDLRLLQLIADRVAIGIEHHRLLDSERAARTDAEAANRMKDEFLATMSHELRTPLNAIVGWTALLRNGLADATIAKKAIETIDRNAKTQARLIEDLLDVSRIISGKLNLVLSDTDLRGIVLAAIDAVRPAAESKQITITEELAPVVSIIADGDRLQQVVWNLVSNAVKFTPRGGAVSIHLDGTTSDLCIIVRDSGEGIPLDVLPFVFERFRQADSSNTRRHAGLGLGLAIVRHLVELHGGHVAATSEGPGNGSTFTVMLPVRAVDALPPESQSAPPAVPLPVVPPMLLRGLRVLAVDDDPDARDLLFTALSRAGAKVTTCASSRAALDAIGSTRPDVIVCDVGMPDEDGYTFVRTLRTLATERGGTTPAIALTAYAREDDVREALAAGFARHIAKPVDPVRIVTSIADVAGKSGKQSPAPP